MFQYDTYDEATKMKSQISTVLLGKDANVVLVSTEKQIHGDKTIFHIRIGLTSTSDSSCVLGVFKRLQNAGIVCSASARAVSAPTFAVSEVGVIQQLSDTFRQKTPMIQPGFSVGNANSTGTIAAILQPLKDGDTSRYVLSNNHVLSSNQNTFQQGIFQPGPSDEPNVANNLIGYLEFFSKIIMTSSSSLAPNFVDVALGKLHDNVIVDASIPKIGSVTRMEDAWIGMPVEKCGRTSGHTHGVINSVDADVVVQYGTDKAIFTNQIQTSFMLQPGDSGSLVVSSQNKTAVGLGFAGSPNYSFANPFSKVNSVLVQHGYSTRFCEPTIVTRGFLHQRFGRRSFFVLSGACLATFALPKKIKKY